MQLQRRNLVIPAVILLILSFPVKGPAAEITVKPKVSAGWRVDGNYYRAETTEREVYTYLIQPGIKLDIATAKSELLLDYTLDAYYYKDKNSVPSGPADENDYVGHTGIIKARYKPFSRLFLGLDNSFYKTRDPARSDPFSAAVGRKKYTINRLTSMISYDLGRKLSLGLRYRNTETDYADTAYEDSIEHRKMFDLIYNFTHTESLDLEYQYWNRNYGLATSDYTSDQIKLIFRKQFRHVSFEAGGGYHNRVFDDPALDDIATATYRIAVSGQNPPEPETPRSHISVAAELNFNDQGIGAKYYKAQRFTLTSGHLFLKKLLVNITGYYQKSDYKSISRKDDTYDISGRISYIFTDRLTFSITAGHEQRRSNLIGYDYDNHYYMAKFEFGYR